MREPDIEIGASVKADELRFETRPRRGRDLHRRPRVVALRQRPGEPARPGGARRHLRDVRVRWHAVAHIDLSEDDPKEAKP